MPGANNHQAQVADETPIQVIEGQPNSEQLNKDQPVTEQLSLDQVSNDQTLVELPGAKTGTHTISTLPRWAQSHIRDLRQENAGHRARAREVEQAAAAAEEQRLVQQQEWQALAEQRAAQIAELEARSAQEADQNNRRAACAAANLPIEWAERLRGETLEALTEDAQNLAGRLTPPPPAVPAGPVPAARAQQTDDAREAALKARFRI